MGLIVRSSDIHAAGVYTTADIKKDTLIVEYTGPRVTREQADAIYENCDFTYLFGLDSGEIIDGHGVAAFINHCCDPNCETDEIDGKIWIQALRDIQAGEELTYDYCLFDGEEDDPAICHCGAKKCRGTMYTEEEIERQKKLKKEQQKELVKA
jgi:SET domain-containing protein